MQVYEILIAESVISQDGGPFVTTDRLSYWVPEPAQVSLQPILGPYHQDPMWYFDNLDLGRPPAPWALACLDREYGISGYLAACRPAGAGISFSPYADHPEPRPNGLAPGVGVLSFASKPGLQQAAANSPLFAAAWDALRDCSIDRRWLVILDPLSDRWLTEIARDAPQRWLSRRGG